tara:strand:- start:65 stop:355 length:291 start_codon:yes stop_codon:yes gene_type:complete
MRYLCLLLVILVVYWYCKNDTIVEGFYFDKKKGLFKKGTGSGKWQLNVTGSTLKAILNYGTVFKHMSTDKKKSIKLYELFNKTSKKFNTNLGDAFS